VLVYRVSGARSGAPGSRTGPAAVQPVEMIPIRENFVRIAPPGTQIDKSPVQPPTTGRRAVKPCNQHIMRTLQLADEMICLADQGENDREDNGCGILFGVLRDSAYKLKKLAEAERLNHVRKGWWPADEG
jgi:hypothetical protein